MTGIKNNGDLAIGAHSAIKVCLMYFTRNLLRCIRRKTNGPKTRCASNLRKGPRVSKSKYFMKAKEASRRCTMEHPIYKNIYN